MKLFDAALFGIVAVAAYKLSRTFKYSIPLQEPKESKMTQGAAGKLEAQSVAAVSPLPLAETEQRGAVSLTPAAEKVIIETITDPDKRSNEERPRFYDLKHETQNTLLRNFSSDYTSPRMIDDDKHYKLCVEVANYTGAPCGWVQALPLNGSDPITMYAAADCMLNYVDETLSEYKFIDDCRLDAIALARTLSHGHK